VFSKPEQNDSEIDRLMLTWESEVFVLLPLLTG
jgi:hypothetical protein